MNLGLSYLAQIKDAFTQRTFQDLIAAIGSGYHTQHNTNDTHKTITATGSITERSRTAAMGEWTSVAFLGSSFTASETGVWTVLAENLFTFAYMLIGKTLFVNFYVQGSIVSVATPTHLLIAIPAKYTAARQQFSTFAYNDNGTLGTGVTQVLSTSGGSVIQLYKDIVGTSTWSLSGNLSVAGQCAFEVSQST